MLTFSVGKPSAERETTFGGILGAISKTYTKPRAITRIIEVMDIISFFFFDNLIPLLIVTQIKNLNYFFARQCGKGEALSGIPRAESHAVLRKKNQVSIPIVTISNGLYSTVSVSSITSSRKLRSFTLPPSFILPRRPFCSESRITIILPFSLIFMVCI